MPVRMCSVEAGGGVVSPSLCPGLGPATRTNVTGILPQVGISSISSAGRADLATVSRIQGHLHTDRRMAMICRDDPKQ